MQQILSIILLVSLSLTLNAQKETSPVNLSNGTRTAIYKNDPQKAVDLAMQLIEAQESFFIDILHSTVLNNIIKASEQGQDMVQNTGLMVLIGLSEKNHPKVNTVIKEELLFARVLVETNSRKKRKLIESYLSDSKDSVYHSSRAQRYSILISRSLDKTNPKEEKLAKAILNKTIEVLLSYPYIDSTGQSAGDEMIASWARFMLATAYFDKSQLPSESKGENLKLAARYSSSPRDAAYKSYNQTEFSLLTGNFMKKGYRTEYLNYLKEHPDHNETLQVKADLCLLNPTDQAMAELKEQHVTAHGSNEGFEHFWNEKVLAVCVPLPVKEFVDQQDSLTHSIGHPEKWTFIDVWGSWCSPCVEEFPTLQEAYEANLKDDDSKLIITTWAFDNPEPMKKLYEKKGFTVPYIHISNDLQKLFFIHSWPTKLLISPQGSYLKIPFGVDWQEFVGNYILAGN